MVVDWDAPFSLVSQFGTLTLNAASGDRYILDRGACDAGAELRVQVDNIPSGDGGITHNVYSSYYVMTMSCSLWVDDAPACGADLNRMVQTLSFHLLGMKLVDGRLFTTPTGYAQRLLDNIRYSSRLTHSLVLEGRLGTGEGRVSAVKFALTSPFPYLITAAQTTTHVNSGGTATLVNNGTTDTYPVVHVAGPTSAFTITNSTTGKQFIYDSTLPGGIAISGGHTVEIDFFRNTAYLGVTGGPYTGANMKAGINVIESDFFPITPAPAGNVLTISGAAMDVLWNQAWG